VQERYRSLERDYEVELLLRADAEEQGAAAATAASARDTSSPLCHSPAVQQACTRAQPPAAGGEGFRQEQLQVLHASRRVRVQQQQAAPAPEAGGGAAEALASRPGAPAVSESMELIVSETTALHASFLH